MFALRLVNKNEKNDLSGQGLTESVRRQQAGTVITRSDTRHRISELRGRLEAQGVQPWEVGDLLLRVALRQDNLEDLVMDARDTVPSVPASLPKAS